MTISHWALYWGAVLEMKLILKEEYDMLHIEVIRPVH